jgi:hypothetical protein
MEKRLYRLALALGTATMITALSVVPALAGEITGNGRLLTVHGHSACAFSGQEDLQWFTDDSDQTPLEDPVRGVPSHSQSWGRIPKADRDFLATIGLHPGEACNPTIGEPE